MDRSTRNLDDTKPIEKLDELKSTRVEKYDKNTRTTRLNNKAFDEFRREKEEEAEEALAEKNILLAESLIKEEKTEILEENSEVDENIEIEEVSTEASNSEEVVPMNEEKAINSKKGSIIDKIKDIPLMIKIILGVCLVAIIAAIIVLIIVLGKDGNEEEKPVVPSEPEVEETIKIVDNFYYKKGSLYFLKDEEVIGEYKCTNEDENLCYVAFNNTDDDFDTDKYFDSYGNVYVKRIPVFFDNYVYIVDKSNEKDNTINLYSMKDKKVIGTYKNVKVFDKQVVYANKDNLYGLDTINEKGLTNVIKPTYEYLGKAPDKENFIAKDKKGYKVIDVKNKVLSKNISLAIKNYSSDLIVVKDKNDYSVYDYEGKLLLSGYEYARVLDGFMALVKDGRVYVRDAKLNKYNEDGIILANDYYTRQFYYDENGKLAKKKMAFTFEKREHDVGIVVYEEDNEDGKYTYMSVDEVEVNKKYDYINYFDKVLYFYSDKEKNNLIGKYNCDNVNFIDSYKDYDLCYVASDTIYEDNETTPNVSRSSRIPIYNNRYVFIKDGKVINLYDLGDSKILSTYSSVNTYTSDNGNNVTLVNGDFNIVAVSQKTGKYGMIRLTKNSVNKVYAFEYKKMEKFDKYILAQNEDNSWMIIYGTGSTSSKYPRKIMKITDDKKYFLTKEGNDYYVYNQNGELLINQKFEHVFFDKEFIVGISDSVLNVYSYNGEKITSEGKTLISKDYSKNPYKVEKKDNILIISILNGNAYDEYKYDMSTNQYVIENKEIEEDKKIEEETTE